MSIVKKSVLIIVSYKKNLEYLALFRHPGSRKSFATDKISNVIRAK